MLNRKVTAVKVESKITELTVYKSFSVRTTSKSPKVTKTSAVHVEGSPNPLKQK